MNSFEAFYIHFTIESIRKLRYQGGFVTAYQYSLNLAIVAGNVIGAGAEPNPIPVGVQRIMAMSGEL